MSYDLFISYSRRDDKRGQVRALKEQIEADYHSFAKEDLRCFFDIEDIASMDDWRHRILEGLRDSNLLLLVLSPAYLDSPYCEWEIVEFLKYEHSRSVGGQGVTPVYFVEIRGLDDPGFEQRAAAWLARVRRRNQVDLRPWYHEGIEALKQADVRTRLDDLERSLQARLSRLRRLREAPGNLPAHNPRFVGREAEMQRLHEAAGLGRFGVLTAVQGMGGVGKTALAIQYAYAYADFYPGGRWLVGCAGETSLASALRRLDLDLRLTLNDAEKRDDTLAARRVLAELERRAIEGAKARSGEKDPPQPKALLLLDNVEHPELLQPPQSDLLTGRQWLHVLATTRSGAEDFGNDPECLTVLSIDELPDDDALRLIESYQPGGRFPNPQEREAALELVKLLGGFTLAVEVVAVHLGERAGRVTCAAFLERMKKEGLGKFDDIIRGTKGGIRHGEKLIGATLTPTLDLLSEPERLVLSYASLLPPDTIPLLWLRVLAAKDFPDLGRDAEPGYDDPWLNLVNHLLGLRLLQTVDLAEDGRTPRLLRMHRLAQAVVRHSSSGDLSRLDACAMEVAGARAEFLRQHCLDGKNRWEIQPLGAYADQALGADSEEALPLADAAATCMLKLGDYAGASSFYNRILARRERILGAEHPDTLETVSSLGISMEAKGDYAAALPLLERALVARERVLGPEHPHTLTSVNNLAFLLARRGDDAGAEPLYRRALATRERVLGPEHPDTLTSVNDVAELLTRKGDYEGAELLFRRAMKAREQVLGAEHPDTLTSVHNLAALLEVRGNCSEAEALYFRTIKARERVLGAAHPHTLLSVNGMALLLQGSGRIAEAEPLFRHSMEGRRKAYGNTHPATANGLVNLARIVLELGRNGEAERLAHESLAIWRQTDVPEDSRSGKAYWVLASVAVRRGDPASARRHLQDALRLLRLGHGEHHPWVVAVRNEMENLQ